MARQRDPRRDEAFAIWKQHGGEMKLKDIAEQLGVLDTQIRKWKSQDKWEPSKGNVTNSKRNVTNQKKSENKTIESDELNDRQQLFCLYYLKYFNATKAYRKVYECSYSTAMANGHKLLRNAQIISEIDRLKNERVTELKLSVRDVLQKYIDIAFSDITDFLQFGREEEVVYDEEGFPELDANGNAKMRAYSYVHLNESTEVDGTILTEVKQGREGISVKLVDKMRALEMLSKYFDLLSDNEKKQLQEEKLKADIAKSKIEAIKLSGDAADEYEDDGFIEALGDAAEVWSDGIDDGTTD